MADPNPCNPGTEHPDNYSDPTSPLQPTACVDSRIKAGKKPIIADFHSIIENHLQIKAGIDYISYIRIQPKVLNPPNCSCMCGCSSG
jgi:hypothetical protein